MDWTAVTGTLNMQYIVKSVDSSARIEIEYQKSAGTTAFPELKAKLKQIRSIDQNKVLASLNKSTASTNSEVVNTADFINVSSALDKKIASFGASVLYGSVAVALFSTTVPPAGLVIAAVAGGAMLYPALARALVIGIAKIMFNEAQGGELKPGDFPLDNLSSATKPIGNPNLQQFSVCNNSTNAGGFGVTRTVHGIGKKSGTVNVSYDMYSIPDQMDVYLNKVLVASTNGFVSGNGTLQIPYNASSSSDNYIEVVVTGNDASTAWDYTVICPQ